MHSSKRTKIIDAICVALVLMTGIVRLFRDEFPQISINAVIFLLFIVAASLWIGQLQRRLVQHQERKYLIGTAFIIMFMMALRTIKFIFLPANHFSVRYAWYLYYFAQVFMILWMFFAVLHIGKSNDRPISRLWKLLYIPAGLLVIGVMTNDIHQLAFRFQVKISNWTDNAHYTYGPVYFACLAWMVAMFVAILVIVFVRCSVSEYRKNIWLPMIPSVIGLLYIILFLINKNLLIIDLFKVAEVICFIFPAFIECLILARLFPSNDSYPMLWNASSIGGGIMDLSGNICFRSKNCVDVSLEQVKLSQTKPIVLNNRDYLLQSHAIHAGYGYWIKNIKKINEINEKLEDLGDVLSEENAMLEEENKLKEKRVKIEQKNKLYDSIALSVRPQLETINNILESLPEDEEEFEKTMKYASVTGVYIKRHSNMLLHLHQKNSLFSDELRLAISESLEYLRLCGIVTHGEYIGEKLLKGNLSLVVYEIFQAIIVSDLYNINAVLLNLIIDDKITMNIQIGGAKKVFDKNQVSDILKKVDAALNIKTEEETEYISLEIFKGGNAYDAN